MSNELRDEASDKEVLIVLARRLDATTSHDEWMQTIRDAVRLERSWRRANREVCGIFLWRYRLDQLLTWGSRKVEDFNTYIERCRESNPNR